LPQQALLWSISLSRIREHDKKCAEYKPLF
jgi:hypothetical protein